MGSTDSGCVDANLRYHGLENLYVLSTATFPGGSSANPTLTLAALTLRLGDHLSSASTGADAGSRAADAQVDHPLSIR
jgi:choline dehydrogenase-like flavoprotein